MLRLTPVRSRTKLVLVRHPQTDWNRSQRYQGHSDRPLTDFGIGTIPGIVDAVAKTTFQAIISTGLQRTDRVAEAVREQQGRLDAITIDERWREVHHGLWEGLRFEEVSRQYPELVRARFSNFWSSRAHGGESMEDLSLRLQQAWNDLVSRHSGKRILLVTHAGVIQLLVCAAVGVSPQRNWQFRCDLSSITYLDIYPAGAILRKLNHVIRK